LPRDTNSAAQAMAFGNFSATTFADSHVAAIALGV
jgi:hypothetical protein